MKTFALQANSHGKAMQEIFMRTGMSMFPRSVADVWCYDELESGEVANTKKNSVLKPCEVATLHKLCDEHRYHPLLWNMLVDAIIKFPNQKRFYQVTFLQPHVIALAFYSLTRSKTTLN